MGWLWGDRVVTGQLGVGYELVTGWLWGGYRVVTDGYAMVT